MKKSIIFSTLIFNLILLGCSSDSSTSTEPEPDPGQSSPKISKIDPSIGAPGNIITITGQGFSTKIEDNKVTINGEIADVVAATDAQIQIKVPDDAKTGKVTIEVNGDLADGPIFTLDSRINFKGEYKTIDYDIDIFADIHTDDGVAHSDTTISIDTGTDVLLQKLGETGATVKLQIKELIRNGLNAALTTLDTNLEPTDVDFNLDVTAEASGDSLTITKNPVVITIPEGYAPIKQLTGILTGDGVIDGDGNMTLNFQFDYHDSQNNKADISSTIKLEKKVRE